MIQRYIAMRNEAMSITSGQSFNFSEQELINFQNEWIQNLNEHLSKVGGFESAPATTMKKIQLAIKDMQNHPKTVTQNLINQYIDELEAKINSMSLNDQIDLYVLTSQDLITSGIITFNVDNGQLQFSRLRKELATLIQLKKSAKNLIRAFNKEFGAIEEVLKTFAANQVAKEFLQDSKKYKNITTIEVGSEHVKDAAGKYGSGLGTTDAGIWYTGSYDGEQVNLVTNLSIKATGTVLDADGNWKPQRISNTGVKIKDISAQLKLWDYILESLGSSSALAQNAALNTLIWENASSKNMKIITKSLIARYFERFIAGGDMFINKQFGMDVADMLLVNGKPFTMMSIIAKVLDNLDRFDTSRFNSPVRVFYSLNPLKQENQKRLGGESNSAFWAYKRSDDVIKKLQYTTRTLSASIYLNPSVILDLL